MLEVNGFEIDLEARRAFDTGTRSRLWFLKVRESGGGFAYRLLNPTDTHRPIEAETLFNMMVGAS